MKKIIFVLSFIFCVINLGAQTIDDVSLVVSGEGPTKESATHVALRSAIEQAYGVFVSANTEILNDELVKDEIATVTSGNVKSYKELSAVVLPNANHLVSLKAVVSTKKLVAYAQSKGVNCEFAGAIFGANLKLYELNKKNTEIAFENLIKQAKALAPYLYEPVLEMGTPSLIKNEDNNINNFSIRCKIKLYSTPSTKQFIDLIYSTFTALTMNKEKREMLESMNLSISKTVIKPRKMNENLNWECIFIGEAWYSGHVDVEERCFYFYADFPFKNFYYEVYNSLPKYSCVLDNFNNQYYDSSIEEIDHWSSKKKSHKLFHSINTVFFNSTNSYHPVRDVYTKGTIMYTWCCNEMFLPILSNNFYIDEALEPSSDFNRKRRKNQQYQFSPQLLSSYDFEIIVPQEKLVKITNFELMKMSEEQKDVYSFIYELISLYVDKTRFVEVYDCINDLVKNKLSNEEDYAIMLSEVVLLDEYRELDELAALVKAEINYKRGDYVSALHLYNEFIKSKGRRYRGSEGRRMFSRGFVEHYFDCIDYFITNNSDEFVFDNDICDFLIPSYRYMAELSEDIVYPVEVYKRMEQLLYKGAKIYTSGAAMLYNILLHIEPDNPEWKRQYNRCFE